MDEEEKVIDVNPNRCYFVVTYADGKIIKGNALSEESWNQILSGIVELKFELSNGSIINIHKHDAYSVDVDFEDGVYYMINVKCLSGEDVTIYRINLRGVPGTALKIGDVIVSRSPVVYEKETIWKYRG